MATTYTTADLARLDKAIADGVLRVSMPNGESVEYRSIDDLRKARDHVAAKLSGRRRRRAYGVYSSKGLT